MSKDPGDVGSPDEIGEAVTPEELGDARGQEGYSDKIEEALTNLFAEATGDGLFPAVAFGLDPNGRPDAIALLTCPISDLPMSLQIVERVVGQPVTANRFIPLGRLKYIGDKNAIMRLWSRTIPGLDTRNADQRRLIYRLMAYCTASRWTSRAFVLVDMVAFSLRSTPEQLALRMSLGQAINQCIKRMYPLSVSGLVSRRSVGGFDRISTGDGFYIWNYDPSTEGHLALFLLMILLMAQTGALHAEDPNALQLRAAFAIGEAYTFPYGGPGVPPPGKLGSFMPDAIGPVLNQLNRYLRDADPGQILVAPFDEDGRENRPGERLNIRTMLTRIRSEILPGELKATEPVKAQDIELVTDPPDVLRITDKHEQVHHCYNIWGRIPHRPFGRDIFLQSIGLVTDSAVELTRTRFKISATAAQQGAAAGGASRRS